MNHETYTKSLALFKRTKSSYRKSEFEYAGLSYDEFVAHAIEFGDLVVNRAGAVGLKQTAQSRRESSQAKRWLAIEAMAER